MIDIRGENENWTCQPVEDLAVIRVHRPPIQLTRSMDAARSLASVVDTIKNSKDGNGVAVIHSGQYDGKSGIKEILSESLEISTTSTENRLGMHLYGITEL